MFLVGVRGKENSGENNKMFYPNNNMSHLVTSHWLELAGLPGSTQNQVDLEVQPHTVLGAGELGLSDKLCQQPLQTTHMQAGQKSCKWLLLNTLQNLYQEYYLLH